MVLARTALGRRSPLSTPSLVVAANLPDIDIVVAICCGREAYLDHHRGLTHSLVGLAAQALLFALLVGWIERRRCARRGAPLPPRWAMLPGIAAALLSHLLLDWLNTYGIRPWLPFSHARHYGDLCNIVDPWLWVILGGAVWLGRRGRARRMLVSCSVLLLLYLGTRGVAREQAWAAARRHLDRALPPAATVLDHVARPHRFDPTQWTMVAATADELIRIDVRLPGDDRTALRYPRRLDDPLVVLAARTPTGRVWRDFARLPLAAAMPLPDGGVRVDLLDGRYGLQPGPQWSTLHVNLSPAEVAALPPGR